MKKIMLIGHGRHGKDTVAEILRDYHGYTLTPASWTFAEEVMRDKYGYATTQACFNARIARRALWGEEIAAYNTPDPAALAKKIMETSDIYVGCRRRREFKEASKLFDCIVWVDRSEHLPPEDSTSMELTQEDAHIILDNNGSMIDLWHEVNWLAQKGIHLC